jgi:integrase
LFKPGQCCWHPQFGHHWRVVHRWTTPLGIGEPHPGRLKLIGGKGNKSRSVYVTNGAQEALHDWLTIRGDEPGAIFTPINKGGRIIMQKMIAQAVYNLLKKRAEQAQVKDFTPHDFRPPSRAK